MQVEAFSFMFLQFPILNLLWLLLPQVTSCLIPINKKRSGMASTATYKVISLVTMNLIGVLLLLQFLGRSIM